MVNAIAPRDDRRSHRAAGALVIALGLFMIFLSLGVIELNTVSRRSALFNDARHWQLTAFGIVFALAGVSLWIPPRFEALGRFNAMALVLTMLLAAAGTVWYGNGGAARQKGGSMTAFLDSIARWFESVGVHPVLRAFLTGLVIAFIFAYRRSAPVDITTGAGMSARSALAGDGTMFSKSLNGSVTINGRTVALSSDVMAHIEAGNKIEAIKALRHESGLDLKDAKTVVDAVADTPSMK